jgi:hypothetical protein
MVMRGMVITAAVCVLLLGSGAAHAADREYWKHDKGHFENTVGNKWVEKSETHTYNFVEKERTEKFVEIYDKERDVTVHLHDDRAAYKKGNGKWETLYTGKWGKR